MRRYRSSITYALTVLLVLQTVYAPRLYADPILGRLGRLFTETHYHGTPPNVCQDGDIEFLAENIDWLEHHIDRYGSIVAKHPDIWGEARLTKHRDEYERQMSRELNQFSFKINAAIAQSDSSFLAQAFALSSAAAGTDGTIPTVQVSGADTSVDARGATIAKLRGVDNSTTSTFANFDAVAPEGKIGIEPVLDLDQRSRYLQHLHELRRINEGDDTSDSPGYALNLVRIPVSILPGKMTREGFGAEITITATPHLSDDLLPNTFRNLVVNDLVDQLGLPLVRTAELISNRDEKEANLEREKKDLETLISNNKEAQKLIETMKEELFKYWYFESDREELQRMFKDFYANKIIRDSTKEMIDLARTYTERKRAGKPILDSEVTEYHRKILKPIERAIANFDAGKDPDWPDRYNLYVAIKGHLDNYSFPTERDALYKRMADYIIKISKEEYDEYQAQEGTNLKMTVARYVDLRDKNIDAKKDLKNEANQDPASIATESRGQSTEPNVEDISKLAKRVRKGFGTATIALDAANEYMVDITKAGIEIREQDLSNVGEKLLRLSVSVSSSAPSGRVRRAGHPLPPSQVGDVFGWDRMESLAKFFYASYYGRYVRWAGQPNSVPGQTSDSVERRVDLLDAQKWLAAELSAAYEFLSQPEHLQIWYELANPNSGLAVAIRSGHLGTSPTVSNGSSTVSPTGHGEENETSDSGHLWSPLTDREFEVLEPHFPEKQRAEQYHSVENCHTVVEFRNCFFDKLRIHQKQAGDHAAGSNAVVENLAWAIVVESALLNQRLNEDIRKTFTAKGCFCSAMGEEDLTFFLPETAAKQDSGFYEYFYPATQAFQEYVKCRWPIHVFAIDPREQDQNVADVSARKRELQFALAIGFVSGQIGGNSLTQYSRDLQTQIETISLNRTVAGFSHGTDTFGWRFYPRVQALDIPGTAGAIRETIFGVSRDCDLHKRQLEPGMRECVAVVLMPSFVPYADFDIRTNWFSLTNPKNAALTMKDTVHLSKAITAMRLSRAQCAQCAECYRPGEVERMISRVEQLDRELPLQSMRAQVPYENTLGGFEMFNTGITDLAPELVGWYGAPGVVITACGEQYSCGCYGGCSNVTGVCGEPKDATDEDVAALRSEFNEFKQTVQAQTTAGQVLAKYEPDPICQGAGTTLFLVGGNFSVHDTKVIAGGVCIPHVRLVSREIMQVTIPSCVNTVKIDDKEYVAVYAATPYGITNHLHVPVHCRCGEDPQHPSICNSCNPAEPQNGGGTEGGVQISPGNDSTSLQLIPLPQVEDNFLETGYMQEPTPAAPQEELPPPVLSQAEIAKAFTAMEQLAIANRQAIENAPTNVTPTEFIVNVQSAEVSSPVATEKEPHCDGPVAKQMKTRCRECWHNLRDLLPCN